MSFVRLLGLASLLAAVVLGSGCGRERSERFPGIMGRDGGGASGDGAVAGDGSMGRDGGGGPGTDGGGGGVDSGGAGTDAGSGAQGTCDPACLEIADSFCCTECGCGGTSGACEPQCDTPYRWDCEIGCCFNSTTFECACPAGTSWDPDVPCCKDSGGTCVVPAG